MMQLPIPMLPSTRTTLRRALALPAVLLALVAVSCASGPKRPPTGTPDPDKFLFERGSE
jgi:hypothetical protein